MLIVNADDWGRSASETDAALACHRHGRVTSVSAMVFMADSVRAARLAREARIDAGLHINFSQEYDGPDVPSSARDHQRPLVRFTTRDRFAVALYNPLLRERFRQAFEDQWNEFIRLYGVAPSHVDGHQHRHLCANLLVDRFVPSGTRVRRNFTYARGQRGIVNRTYRMLFDRVLARRYRLTDRFFSLGEALKHQRLEPLFLAARSHVVEVMAHPVVTLERDFLLSDRFVTLAKGVALGSFNGC